MWKTILFYLVVYGLAAFYSWTLALSFLWKYITNPSVKFWRVKRRDTPPDCLTNPDYGQHSYIQLKVRRASPAKL